MTFEFIMWYGVEKFVQEVQLCFQDLFDHGSYTWVHQCCYCCKLLVLKQCCCDFLIDLILRHIKRSTFVFSLTNLYFALGGHIFFNFSFIIYLIFGLGLVRRGELGSLLWLVFLWLVWWLKEKSPLSKVWVDLMTISLMWSQTLLVDFQTLKVSSWA